MSGNLRRAVRVPGNAGARHRALLVAALVLPLGACEWFTDFKRQPKIDPWEAYTYDSVSHFRGQPQGSVPITGSAVPGYAISHAPTPQAVDSMSSVPNPVAISEASLVNGRKYFEINCAVCHGIAGAGDGTATKYGFAAINLLTPLTQNRTDGYIFGVIRNGRGLMPSYNRIEERDRWDVVNYLRALQGKAGITVPTGPVGQPGETGAKVPGATTLGPTRPAPFHPTRADTATARNPGVQP